MMQLRTLDDMAREARYALGSVLIPLTLHVQVTQVTERGAVTLDIDGRTYLATRAAVRAMPRTDGRRAVALLALHLIQHMATQIQRGAPLIEIEDTVDQLSSVNGAMRAAVEDHDTRMQSESRRRGKS
jgi:hypothetical protein